MDSRKQSLSMGENIEMEDYNLQTWNMQYLKRAALYQKLARPRSLAWAIMLEALPEPSKDLLVSLALNRQNYEQLKNRFSKDPRTVDGDDPLSQHDESAWNQHFCDNELKALILQDVVRTFPDELYFRDSSVQDLMVRVLFIWARSHPKVGYRQGMHEILAPLLFEMFLDRKYAPNVLSDKLKEYLRQECLENDSHMLFTAVMKGLKKFYTTGDIAPTSCGRLPTSNTLHNPNEAVKYLEKVKEEHLVPLDTELSTHLNNCNISMELFGIRWLRLLFGREFPRSEIPHLWSYLFIDGPMLPSIHYVIIAMLLSMKKTLMDQDAGVVLSALMRPVGLSVGHVIAYALYLAKPLLYSRPPTPPPPTVSSSSTSTPGSDNFSRQWSLEERGVSGHGSAAGDEGVAEGADVARELATLALLRAQLPSAAAALAHAMPRPPTHIAQPLQKILQLSALLQCRNHALVDVETALEAAEGQAPEKVRKKQLVPITVVNSGKRFSNATKQGAKPMQRQVKEVPLKLFHQCECDSNMSDLPCLDPLRLRTE